MWSPELKDEVVYYEGSVQSIQRIPKSLRDLYKTVWDTRQKVVIDLAADRGRYICQSQSMNLHLATPEFRQVQSMLVYAWKCGLKTGMYYLRTRPASRAQQFTIDPTKFGSSARRNAKNQTLPVDDDEDGCIACSA